MDMKNRSHTSRSMHALDAQLSSLRSRFEEALKALEFYVQTFPAFHGKPIGAPYSEERQKQERHVLAERAAAFLIAENPLPADPVREALADAVQEFANEDVSDARALAKSILNNRHHSVTGTEAERIASLLHYLERSSRVARAAIVKANGGAA